jgi:hypothetical protein
MKKLCLILSAFLLLVSSGLAFGSKSVKQPEVDGGIARPYADPQPSHYTLIIAESIFDTVGDAVPVAFEPTVVVVPIAESTIVSESISDTANVDALTELVQTAVSGSIAVSGSAVVTPAPSTLAQAAVAESDAVSESISDTVNTVALAELVQVTVTESVAVSESAAPQIVFGALTVQDSDGVQYQPDIYDAVGRDDSREGGASDNVRIYSYILPADRQLSLLYEGALGRQTQDFKLNSNQTMWIKTDRSMVDVERVATRYEEREFTVIVTENTASADAELSEEAEEENPAVALAADEDYIEDDSGWNVEDEEFAEAEEAEEVEYEYVEIGEDEEYVAAEGEEVEYEYVEVDEDEEREYADADESAYLAETAPEVSADQELTLAAAIVTREITVTESILVTESYIAQEVSENIEFTLALVENLNEQYDLSLTEQAYYTLTVAEALYDNTPGRRAHAFGRLTVTDEDDHVFTARLSGWTDNSRNGAFNNNARVRRFLVPLNTTLHFKYHSGNTALSMLDCDELYPDPLLNYELDGTLGSLNVTRLEMNNNYVIHIRAGWGDADAGRPVRLVNQSAQ